jgi:regulator of sirC expression with transglutaminase-like and TPR domain
VSLLLGAGCATQSRPAEPRHIPPEPVAAPIQNTQVDQTLEQMLEHDDFDLPRALLLFSEKYYPEFSGGHHDVDVRAKLARFEGYVDQLKRELVRETSPRRKARVLSDFVHLKLGLRSDPAGESGVNPENLFFDRVIQNRTGYCVSLSLAYIVFGQAAGLDVKGIRIPGHFAVRFTDREPSGESFETNLETTDFGSQRDDLYFFAEYRFSTTSVKHGVYLTPLSDRQIFGTLYNNLAGLTYTRGNYDLAVERYTRALQLAPNNGEAMYNRALALRKLKRPQEGMRDLNEALRLDPNAVLALMLRAGFFWDAGEKDQARNDLAEAMRKQPKWVEPLMLDGQFLLDDRQYDEARKVFHRVLEMKPGFKSAHLALVELETAAGNIAQARKHAAEAQRE